MFDNTIKFPNQLIDASSDYNITCIDIGARGGPESDLLPIGKAVDIICFEPEREEAQRLAQNKDERWRSMTVLPTAVGGVKGMQTLYIPPSKIGASLLRHNPEMLHKFGYEGLHGNGSTSEVETTTLDQLVVEGHLQKASYMKIDVEGAELSVLKGAESLLRTTLAMRIEVSFLEQRIHQPLIWEVVAWLREHGFEVIDILDIHRWRRRPVPADPYRSDFSMPYSKGRVAQCDIVVFKNNDQLVNENQCIELVLISAALGYFDCGIELLRKNAKIKDVWFQRHGFCLEQLLTKAADQFGVYASWVDLARSSRLLIPKIRSSFWGIPYATPRLPY